ncbi:hypothetical protein ACWYXJ_08130 [Janthinobacterium lividum]|jgi:hypothetical protein|uniref:hypothetical protein n=1 Tax=Janthinobacterium sp. LM6 TaxID=1938606 RepID=UPI000983F796|nr:hypothetical protein [Janthinobacterium sp. LM6]AQR68749.1 hypothetical protein BZG29_10650 [Janthinobacterium sp. LM6]
MKKIRHFPLLGVSLLISLAGCGPSAEYPPPRPAEKTAASQLSKPIMLKDLSTGIKAGKSVADGYLGKWSYFGKPRVVTTEQLADGTITAITVLLEGSDLYPLKSELEERYSKEEGHPVTFSCNLAFRRLPALDNLRISDENCIVYHADQILRIHSIFPSDTQMINKLWSARALFYTTKLTLVDAGLEARREAAIKMASDEKRAAEEARAKKDL